jgi:DNA-binding NtrC family response regulator
MSAAELPVQIITARSGGESIDGLAAQLRAEAIPYGFVDPSGEAGLSVPAPCVGILDFQGLSESEVKRMVALTSQGDSYWIALMPTDTRRLSDSLRRAIWSRCWSSVDLSMPMQVIIGLIRGALHHLLLAPRESAPMTQFGFGPLVGNSPAMRSMFGALERIAPAHAPVLVLGETGTGKELIARALHDNSPRARNPFVAVNCGALPSHLVASELFGHERGAFTGAVATRIGRLEQANRGTLFLDEIGDLPIDAQTYLLRALQEGVIERLGAAREIPVDVRIVAATNVDLEGSVEAGKFRLDLLHRLKVLEINVPPLRVRGADVRLLAEHFLERFKPETKRRIRGFSDDALRSIAVHDWPGNVRELSNRVRQACVMGESPWIRSQDLGLEETGAVLVPTLDEARRTAEVEAIRQALVASDHKLSKAAEALGVSRMTLYRMIQKYSADLVGLTELDHMASQDPTAHVPSAA